MSDEPTQKPDGMNEQQIRLLVSNPGLGLAMSAAMGREVLPEGILQKLVESPHFGAILRQILGSREALDEYSLEEFHFLAADKRIRYLLKKLIAEYSQTNERGNWLLELLGFIKKLLGREETGRPRHLRLPSLVKLKVTVAVAITSGVAGTGLGIVIQVHLTSKVEAKVEAKVEKKIDTSVEMLSKKLEEVKVRGIHEGCDKCLAPTTMTGTLTLTTPKELPVNVAVNLPFLKGPVPLNVKLDGIPPYPSYPTSFELKALHIDPLELKALHIDPLLIKPMRVDSLPVSTLTPAPLFQREGLSPNTDQGKTYASSCAAGQPDDQILRVVYPLNYAETSTCELRMRLDSHNKSVVGAVCGCFPEPPSQLQIAPEDFQLPSAFFDGRWRFAPRLAAFVRVTKHRSGFLHWGEAHYEVSVQAAPYPNLQIADSARKSSAPQNSPITNASVKGLEDQRPSSPK
jgi:hypothetical protein